MDSYLKIVTFLVLVLFIIKVKANNTSGEIQGTIKDLDTKQNIEYATIALFSEPDSSLITGTISNVDGVFVMHNVTFGKYFIKITCLGYQEKVLDNITINQIQETINLGEIHLQSSSENLDEVVVTAERKAVEYHIDKDVINVAQSTNNSGGMIADILDNHPAIETSFDGSVKLRGSTNFIVLIDGKPTSDESNNILNQVPAVSIDKIEIITNPSAKYDANHAAGIVNLITRKTKLTGFSGIYNGSISNAERYNTNLSLNYKTEKINVSIQSELYHSPIFQDRTSIEERIVDGQNGFQNFHSDNILLWEGKSINAGIDYYASKKNTISLFVNRGSTVFGWSPQKTISEGTGIDTNFYILDDYMRNYRDAWHFNVSDVHQFTEIGHEISFDANIIIVDMSRKNNQFLYNSDNIWTLEELTEEYRLKRYQKIMRQQYRVDYTLPMQNHSKLETGLMLKWDNRTIENDIITQKHESNAILNNDKYEAYNNLYALYSTLFNRILKNDIQIGLRLEYVNRNTNLINGNFSRTYNQLDFFPSLNISRKFVNNHAIRVGYSRSVWRPTDLQLNPTTYFRDISGEFSGNSELLPSYNSSIELNYNMPIGNHSLSATAFYRNTKNNIMTVRYLTPDSVYKNNPENLHGGQRDIGVEFSGNVNCFKWLSLNPAGNFYNGYIHGEITNQAIDRRSNVWSLRLITNIKPHQNTRIMLNAYYNSPTLGDQVSMAEIYGLSFTVRQDFFKNKLSLSISGDDILRTEKRRFNLEGNNFKQQIIDNFPKHPIFSLNLAVKLNNFTTKQRENVENGIGFN